jgi:hypothetical protein
MRKRKKVKDAPKKKKKTGEITIIDVGDIIVT